MIKGDGLEKSAKLQKTKTDKVERQKMNDDLKPQKVKKTFVKMPKINKPTREEMAPKKEYREYRSIIMPVVGGGTWLAYKQLSENPTDTDYQQLMGSIVRSPDLNELIQDNLNYFDTSNGVFKILLTSLAKVFEVSMVKYRANDTASPNLSDSSQFVQPEHLEEEIETPQN